MKKNIDKVKTKLKKAWEEQPVIVIMVASATASVVLKTIETMNATRNSRAWAKEVDRRDKMDR